MMLSKIFGAVVSLVLVTFALPQAALAWSLFAFNVGVEIGQLLIVLIVAGILMWIRSRSATGARTIAVAGSIGVITAGLYWFVQRVFL